ncbi:hypothetical protein LCGC14_2222520 [marine sediment metagenome]|uniref:Peptidase S9 prolyl oligopeptidase catalytic domain-containing protein n=1 Tax=marine sediment metagenome TaxID=412755 RepID=A0A0F9FN49_9ZZZZ
MKHLTLFYQGNSASRGQAAPYTRQAVYSLAEGERKSWRCKTAANLLYNIYECEELADVLFSAGLNPYLWLSKATRAVCNAWSGIEGPAHCSDPTRWSVGSRPDREQCARALERAASETDQQLVLFGCSRGAATTFATVCECAMDGSQALARVRLVILEAPFDSVRSVLQASAWLPGLQHYALGLFSQYDADEVSPLELAQHFPLDLPVAFVMSAADTRVPPECTERLVSALRARGHTGVHTLLLQRSSHPSFASADADDVARYEVFLHELYARYLEK